MYEKAQPPQSEHCDTDCNHHHYRYDCHDHERIPHQTKCGTQTDAAELQHASVVLYAVPHVATTIGELLAVHLTHNSEFLNDSELEASEQFFEV